MTAQDENTSSTNQAEPILQIAAALAPALKRLQVAEMAAWNAKQAGDEAAAIRLSREEEAASRTVDALRFEALSIEASSPAEATVQLVLAAALADMAVGGSSRELQEQAATGMERAIEAALRFFGQSVDPDLAEYYLGEAPLAA